VHPTYSGFSLSDQILHLDESLIVINKPSGILSIPDGYQPTLPCVSRILQNEFGAIWTVHRLDKETSGLLLFARDPVSHRELSGQFASREINKTYHAIIEGCPAWVQKEVTSPLVINGDRRHRTTIDFELGKPASTSFSILEKFTNFFLSACFPKTGYTHQIRIHLSSIGLPIVCDKLYNSRYKKINQMAGFPSVNFIDRLALHAYEIQLTHPISGQEISFQAPYPNDFRQALTLLRQNNNSGS
jgi:RluA family pseudouridine synthase